MASGSEDSSGRALFARELQAAREKADISQEALAAKINYSGSSVAMIESCRRAATPEFARRCDEALETPGTFARLQQHAGATLVPTWFRPYAEVEATATQLCLFEHSLVPGLLQTEDYARAVTSVQPNTTDAEVDERVAARMERQAILDRARPPLLWVVLDEGVLHRQVGSVKTAHGQLLHLADMSARPNINILVVPFSAGAHYAVLGAFAIADEDDKARVCYLETAWQGYIVESRSAIGKLTLIFDTLRSEALPRSASRDLILKVAGEHDQPD